MPIPAHVPTLNCPDTWKAPSSQTSASHYQSCSQPEEWHPCSGTQCSDPAPPPICLMEWHFPLMCLRCFGTQLSNWPLIRWGASRAHTVTVEKEKKENILWERSSSSGSPHHISLCSLKGIIVGGKSHWGSGGAPWPRAHIDKLRKCVIEYCKIKTAAC